MFKLYACIISANAKDEKASILSIAQDFSSGIEMLEDGVLFDVSGLQDLIGDADEIARRIELKLKEHELAANSAVAGSADTAILMARQTADVNTFSQLPLRDLQIDNDTLDIFDALGIQKISDLQQIPAHDLINRYGQKFRDVIDIIEQKGSRILTPNVKENSLTWAYDLDFPVEDFEQLIFVVNHGLSKLFARISYSAMSTEHIDIHLGLRKKEEKFYEIKTSFPTLERAFWLKLVNLRIALDPPASEIISVRVVTHFTRPRPNQRGLYSVSRPEPESLLLTVNKIKKLVGEANVGVPVLLDQRVERPFALDGTRTPSSANTVRNGETLSGTSRREFPRSAIIAFNYFHPPLRAEICVSEGCLTFIRTQHFSGRVIEYGGVWRANSCWWDKLWSSQEWDIEIEHAGIYRLARTSGEWFVVGEYD